MRYINCVSCQICLGDFVLIHSQFGMILLKFSLLTIKRTKQSVTTYFSQTPQMPFNL